MCVCVCVCACVSSTRLVTACGCGGRQHAVQGGWLQDVDPRTGKTFFVNHVTKQWSWDAPVAEVIHIQPIAFGVSFNINLQSQSPWSLFNGTW